MERQKGIAYCGLACAVCSENASCAGCRNGGCENKESCKNSECCREKGLDGCWECGEFPCDINIFSKLRIRVFAGFVREYGPEFLLDCLEENEKNGIIYHYPGKLIGDYDMLKTGDEIIDLIIHGKKNLSK